MYLKRSSNFSFTSKIIVKKICAINRNFELLFLKSFVSALMCIMVMTKNKWISKKSNKNKNNKRNNKNLYDLIIICVCLLLCPKNKCYLFNHIYLLPNFDNFFVIYRFFKFIFFVFLSKTKIKISLLIYFRNNILDILWSISIKQRKMSFISNFWKDTIMVLCSVCHCNIRTLSQSSQKLIYNTQVKLKLIFKRKKFESKCRHFDSVFYLVFGPHLALRNVFVIQ